MEISIKDRYDNYNTGSVLPLQFAIRYDYSDIPARMDRIIVTAVSDDGTESVRTYTGKKTVDREIFLKLELDRDVGPRDYDLRLDFMDGDEILFSRDAGLRTCGIENLPKSDDMTDSLYIRMLCDNDFFDFRTLGQAIGLDNLSRHERFYRPELPSAVERMRGIYNYFLDYDIERTSVKDGCIRGCNIIEASDQYKCNICTVGLLFCHILYKMNLDPVMSLIDDACYVGIPVSGFSLERTPYDHSLCPFDTGLDGLPSISNDYLMLDLSERGSFSESLSKAHDHFAVNGLTDPCSIRMKKEKERRVNVWRAADGL